MSGRNPRCAERRSCAPSTGLTLGRAQGHQLRKRTRSSNSGIITLRRHRMDRLAAHSGRAPHHLDHGRGPVRRAPNVDPFEGPRSDDLGRWVKRPKVGRARRFEQYPGVVDRGHAHDSCPAAWRAARELATRAAKPAANIAAVADLLADFARFRRICRSAKTGHRGRRTVGRA